jgi:hypothetical protein
VPQPSPTVQIGTASFFSPLSFLIAISIRLHPSFVPFIFLFIFLSLSALTPAIEEPPSPRYSPTGPGGLGGGPGGGGPGVGPSGKRRNQITHPEQPGEQQKRDALASYQEELRRQMDEALQKKKDLQRRKHEEDAAEARGLLSL